MADFCQQCSVWLFEKDHHELSGLSTPQDTENGLFAQVLCESCGAVLVDHLGVCVDKLCPVHGENPEWDSAGDPVGKTSWKK